MIRYSREDMLHLWKPSKILNSMKDMTDMVSVASLHPMSLQPLEQEDVSGGETITSRNLIKFQTITNCNIL